MADWLRPAFTRTRTPVQGAPATFESRAREPSSAEEAIHEENGLPTPRLRPSSRVSSYIGFRPSSPAAPCVAAQDDFQNARNPENMYHKPSGDQMAETLKVVMMTRYTIDPIPVEYNTCILHVLEAYQELRVKVDGSEAVLEKIKEEHEKDLEEFGKMSLSWETKERDYKAEIKNLEILLANTKGGMEKVVLARSNSKVYGSMRTSGEIRRSFGTIKERNEIRNRKDESVQQNEDQYQHRDAKHMLHASGVSQSYLEELDKQHMERQRQEEHIRAMSSFESSSGIDSSSESVTGSQGLIERENPVRDNNFGLGLGIITEDKPLPPTPRSPGEDTPRVFHSTAMLLKESMLDDTSLGLDRELSFSFQKGDDSSVLLADDKTAKIKRQILEDLVRHRKFAASSPQMDESDMMEAYLATKSSRQPLAGPSLKSTPLPKLAQFDSIRPDSGPRSGGNITNLQICDPPSRDSSTASVKTAIRDSPGRSSVSTSRNESRNGLSQLDRRGGGTNQAVTAASKAYAASNNKRGNGRTGGSSATGREGSSTVNDRDTEGELRMKEQEKRTPKINVSRDYDRDRARTN